MGRLALYSLIVGVLNFPIYISSNVLWIISRLAGLSIYEKQALAVMFLSSIVLISVGTLFIIDLVVWPRLFSKKTKGIFYKPIKDPKISVVMTAYNDEIPTGNAVRDFLAQENVAEVVVVDNNSVDNTTKVAEEAGARAIREENQGYGFAAARALSEAKHDIIVLVESDRTFRGYDLRKIVTYLDNADLVLGTRTTQEFLDRDTQITWFSNWGNIFIAKLIQARFSNTVRLTDVGCSLRAIRRDAYEKIKDQLVVGGHPFLPHMLMVALQNELKAIEIPVTFTKREGESKGAGRSNWAGFKVGLEMIREILTF